MKDLLPCSEHRLASGDWDRQRRSQQRRLQVRVAVSILPGLFVFIASARRNEFIQDSGQVLFQSRLKLDSSDCRCAANVEHAYYPSLDFRLPTTALTCSVRSCMSPLPEVEIDICSW